jgi:hypothetical protein
LSHCAATPDSKRNFTVKSEDIRLISSILFAAIKEGEAEPRIALRFGTELARQARQDDTPFRLQEFIDRCVPPRYRYQLGRVSRGAISANEERTTPVQIEDNAALFSAILAVEFPHLTDRVSCALTASQQSRFTIGRVGERIWIRFGGQALLDPIAAVKAAAPDAEAMALRQTAATRIVGR